MMYGLYSWMNCNCELVLPSLCIMSCLLVQVVSRGGFHVGNGINWKGQVFAKMRNHTSVNKMTVRFVDCLLDISIAIG